MNIAVVLTAVFLATGQGAHSSVPRGDPPTATSSIAVSSTPTPSPAVSITASGPVLTQQSPTTRRS